MTLVFSASRGAFSSVTHISGKTGENLSMAPFNDWNIPDPPFFEEFLKKNEKMIVFQCWVKTISCHELTFK